MGFPLIPPLIFGTIFAITLLIAHLNQDVVIKPGCGEHLISDLYEMPILGVTTKDVSYGGSDHKLAGRILANGQWSDWRKLDTVGCDDRERGNTDFYDTFSDITDEWEAVALYMCGTDGWAMDSLTYWNGTDSRNEIVVFCDNVAGPSVECYKNEIQDPDARCYKGYEDRIFDYVWIDQDNSGCPGVNIALKTARGEDLFIGKLFHKSNPGVPDCSKVSAKTVHYNHDYNEQNPINSGVNVLAISSPLILYVIFGLVISLLLANIVCICYYRNWCCNKSSEKYKYGKVHQVVVSSNDDEQHLNA